MKKIIAITTVLVLAFALSGCVTQVTREGKSSLSASDTPAPVSSKSTSASSSDKSVSASVSSGSASAATSSSAAGTQSDQQAQGSTNNNNGAAFDVEALVQNAGLGQYKRYFWVPGTGSAGYWGIVTIAADGSEVVTYTDEQGNILQGGLPEGVDPNAGTGAGANTTASATSDYDGADFNVEALVQNNNLGQFKRYYWIQGENGTGYWGIVSVAADGSEITTYTDEQGNIIQGGIEVGSTPSAAANASDNGASFSVEAVVQNNNLGQYQHYYWVQNADGTGYWAIVTSAADGSEVTTYTDEQGNIVQAVQ